MIIATALRMIIANSLQTLSSTILMESYEHISPSLGNMLNTLIIISGIVGLIVVKQFIYPRLIRNEVLATLVLIVLSVIPIGVMLYLGKVTVTIMVLSMCVATAIHTVVWLWIVMLVICGILAAIAFPLRKRFKY